MAEEEQKSTKLTRKQDRLLQAAVAIRKSEPTEEEQAFLTLYLTQATLPHRQPIGNENFLNLEKEERSHNRSFTLPCYNLGRKCLLFGPYYPERHATRNLTMDVNSPGATINFADFDPSKEAPRGLLSRYGIGHEPSTESLATLTIIKD